MKFLLALLAAAAILLAWHLSGRESSRAPARETQAVVPAAPAKLPASAVLNVRPGTEGPASARAAASSPPGPAQATMSENMRQFRARQDYATLYRRLEQDPSSEAKYLRARIYAQCTAADGRSRDERAAARAARAAQFDAALAAATTNVGRRREAYQRLNADPCGDLDLGRFDRARYAAMLAEAANAGDVKARAQELAERIGGFRDDATRSRPYRVDEQDMAAMRSLLASRDPAAILALQPILASSLEGAAIQLNGQSIDQRALHSALGLLACEAGAECGPNAARLLMDCAHHGRCSANDAFEHAYYYEHSPFQSQLINDYLQTLRAMLRNGDFGGLTLLPGAGTPDYTTVFSVSGPGG